MGSKSVLEAGAYSCPVPVAGDQAANDLGQLPLNKMRFFAAISEPGAKGAHGLVAYEQKLWATVPSLIEELRKSKLPGGEMTAQREAHIGLYLLYAGMITEATNTAALEGRLKPGDLPMHGCDRPATLNAMLHERSKMGLELLQRAAGILSQPKTFPFHNRDQSISHFPESYKYSMVFYEKGAMPDDYFAKALDRVMHGGVFEVLVTLISLQGTLDEKQTAKLREVILLKPEHFAREAAQNAKERPRDFGMSPLAPNAKASAMVLLGNVTAGDRRYDGFTKAMYEAGLSMGSEDWTLRRDLQQWKALHALPASSTNPLQPPRVTCASCHTPRTK
jgi:hypothetical protein